MDARDELLDRTMTARAAAWQAFGEVDSDVLSHLVNPALMGGPRWPAMRQAYRVARRPGAVLLASDGLSDPYDAGEGDPDVNGLGLEFYASTADQLEQLPSSWLWDLVWQMSNFAASHGGIRDALDDMGMLSTELYDVSIPDEHREKFVNDEGRVGVLLALRDESIPGSIDGPLSPIQLVNVKLLTLPELDFVASNGASGRQHLASLFTGPSATASSLLRRSLV